MTINPLVVSALLLTTMTVLPSRAAAASDNCEVTIERMRAVAVGDANFTPGMDFSPSARVWLSLGSESVKGAPTHWRMIQKQTLQFPPPGESRVIALPDAGLGISAIELRHLPGKRPDWFALYRGVPVGNAVPHTCPTRYYSGFADVAKDRALAVTIHPPGQIQARPDLARFEKNL